MRRLARSVAVALLLLAPASALADARQEARRHFRAGMELIKKGDYDRGIAELETAYGIKPHPNVLFNIAKAQLDAGRQADALETFRRYLDTDPPDRADVQATVEKLAAAVEKPAVQPEAPAAPVEKAAEAQRLAALMDRLEKTLDRAERVLGERRAEKQPASAEQPAAPANDDARGAETEAGVGTYEEVVVSASKRAENALEAPVATTVLSEEEIRLSGARTLPELLRRVPGADVMMMGVSSANISMRGFNQRIANKVLVLVDGRSVYEDFLGFTLWPVLPIGLEDVERIEVIRGPGSTLYGANAFAGVVNIITRPPGTGPRVAASLTGGSGSSALAEGAMSGREGRVRYRASAAHGQADKYSLDFPLDRTDIRSNPNVRDPSLGFSATRANAVVELDLGARRKLAVSGGANRLQSEIYPLGLLRNFYIDGAEGYAGLDAQAGPLRLKTWWNRLDAVSGPQFWPEGAPPIDTTVRSDVVNAELQAQEDVKLFGEHRLVGGLGYRLKRLRWTFLPALAIENHFSGFVQDEYRPVDKLRLVGSYRIDRHPLLDGGKPGFAQSPRGAVIFLPRPSQALRATVSTAFRVPTFLESYVDVRLPVSGLDAADVESVGNRALKPERVFHAELGYSGEFDRLNLDLAAYRSEVTALIVLSPLSPPSARGSTGPDGGASRFLLGQSQFVNDPPRYTAYGLELGARASPLDRTDVRVSAALERITVADLDEAACAPCGQVPRLKLFAGGSYRSPLGLDFSLDGAFVGAQTFVEREPSRVTPTEIEFVRNALDSYVVANGRVAYRFLGDRVTVALAGTNLAAPHKEHPFGNLVDRRVYLTLGGAL